jgi:hypothetical protein
MSRTSKVALGLHLRVGLEYSLSAGLKSNTPGTNVVYPYLTIRAETIQIGKAKAFAKI